MKNFVIKLVKNNPLLYRGAKKVYRTFQPAKPTIYRNHDYNIVYQISDPEEMPGVVKEYNSFRRDNTRLVVLVRGNTLKMYSLTARYPGVIFYSLDYYKKYRKTMNINNMILTECGGKVKDIIEIL